MYVNIVSASVDRQGLYHLLVHVACLSPYTLSLRVAM